jgi:2-polyprenyl-6-methoxyphenol hydroxylase-like FAD-dependent oxidoreductase
MGRRKRITIVGGGLAGLTLGIGLRLRQVPVTIWEAGKYPRHRVCGEFVSGRGQDVLTRFGLNEAFFKAGAVLASTAAFFVGKGRSPVRSLMPPAWCLSRVAMDRILAERFDECGGELRDNSRWRGNQASEGLVFANGRRLHSQEDGWRWCGLKVHAMHAQLEADLEMHSVPDGYVGLCRLPGGEVNVCGLFRGRAPLPATHGHWDELLRGALGTVLRLRLDQALFKPESFCSIAGLGIRPHRAARQKELSIGDALTMIPPVTGNGMSMAFEAAGLATAPLAAYSAGSISWDEARQKVSRACDHAFARRLAWARLLQWFMFAPAFKSSLGTVALRSRVLWRLMFAMTR